MSIEYDSQMLTLIRVLLSMKGISVAWQQRFCQPQSNNNNNTHSILIEHAASLLANKQLANCTFIDWKVFRLTLLHNMRSNSAQFTKLSSQFKANTRNEEKLLLNEIFSLSTRKKFEKNTQHTQKWSQMSHRKYTPHRAESTWIRLKRQYATDRCAVQRFNSTILSHKRLNEFRLIRRHARNVCLIIARDREGQSICTLISYYPDNCIAKKMLRVVFVYCSFWFFFLFFSVAPFIFRVSHIFKKCACILPY